MRGASLVVGMLGLGTVGTGVARLLAEHGGEVAARVGAPVELGPVAVRDLAKARDVPAKVTDDPQTVVRDPEVDIVVEVMGGLEPTGTLVGEALEAGKSVVTANKELIAAHGPDLAARAQAAGVRLEYEAAVAGAIPIIKPLRESLAGDRVRKVLGILNGTTNYILTRMTEEGADLHAVLGEAQALGYAEADPSADIDGHDAAAKTAILASLAFDARIAREDVYTEGIRGIQQRDIANAARMGYVIKLLGIAEEVDGAVGVRVHPALLPASHPLANVRESFNAIFIEAEAAGDLMFYGRGAGSLPTASAVVGDVVTVARALLAGERLPSVTAVDKPLRDILEALVQASVLLDVADQPGVLARVAAIFGDHAVSIRSVWQEGQGDRAQLLLITHAARQGNITACVKELHTLDVVRDVASVLRVEGPEVN